jgi:hypothetical protein
MLKRMGKKIITGLMIALMVVGIFVSIANFTAVSAYAKPAVDFYFGTWMMGTCEPIVVLYPSCLVIHWGL